MSAPLASLRDLCKKSQDISMLGLAVPLEREGRRLMQVGWPFFFCKKVVELKQGWVFKLDNSKGINI